MRVRINAPAVCSRPLGASYDKDSRAPVAANDQPIQARALATFSTGWPCRMRRISTSIFFPDRV